MSSTLAYLIYEKKSKPILFKILICLLPFILNEKSAMAITINFDAISTGTSGVGAVSDEFASLGVIFSLVRGSDGGTQDLPVVRDPVFGNGATSLPNGASFGFQGNLGVATFFDPVTGAPGTTNAVNAYVGDRSGEADPITMTAYNLSGQIIGQHSFTSQPTNVLGIQDFGLVSIIAAGIHQIVFSDASPSGASFDDFTFAPVVAAGGGGNQPIPEPSTMCLFGTAAIAAYARRRRAKEEDLSI